MVNWFSRMHLRNRRLWQAIVARMSPQCRAACTTIESGRAEALGAFWIKTPQLAFRDAGVLMEMADYAERNMLPSDSARIRHARNAALQLRFAAARAMITRYSLR